MHFSSALKGLSAAENCLRPESVPLKDKKEKSLPLKTFKTSIYYMYLQHKY